jgi:HEAT repeat protein
MASLDDDSEYDPENPDPEGRFLEMFWFPNRDWAVQRILESAERVPATLVRTLHEATRQENPGESFFAIVCCLADLLTVGDDSVRRAAARLLGDAFSAIEAPILQVGSFVPKELEQAVPAILQAAAIPDSEIRSSLLRALACLPPRRCGPSIVGPLTEHFFGDRDPGVVTQAIGVLMATGVDAASGAIPAIIGLLGHQDVGVRQRACEALAEFGAEASPAVPQLVRMTRDETDRNLRHRAALTLAAVDEEGSLTSQELADPRARETFLSLLREVGPGTRALRRRLQSLGAAQDRPTGKGSSPAQGAAHGDDFRSVNWFGQEYTFTTNQAACVQVLWEHWERGTPEVGLTKILERAGVAVNRLDVVFRDHPAWGTMIVSGRTKGAYRLAPPVEI